MYRLSAILLSLLIGGFGVFALAKSVKFKPWTKPGQEKEYEELQVTLKRSAQAQLSGSAPRAVCDDKSFDFGLMSPMSNGSHTFKIKNLGNAPLILKGGGATCICTMSDLSIVELAPHQTHDVTLSWFTRASDRSFAHSVNVITNDPEQSEIQLSVRGEVAAIVGLTRASLEFDELAPDASSTAEFSIFSELWEKLHIDRIETSSPSVVCSVQTHPTSEVGVSARAKSVVNFEVCVTSTELDSGEFVRVYVRPDEEWLSQGAENFEERQAALQSLDLQEDGTLVVQIPLNGRLLRRFGLYGPSINDADKKIINFGNHFVSKTLGQEWKLVGRVRGNIKPDEVRVTLSGMPGLSARVEPTARGDTTEEFKDFYRFTIRIDEQLKPAIYDKRTPGKLRIDTPGLPGSESVEFDVYMVVLADNS